MNDNLTTRIESNVAFLLAQLLMKFFNQIISIHASEIAMYFVSVVESAMLSLQKNWIYQQPKFVTNEKNPWVKITHRLPT